MINHKTIQRLADEAASGVNTHICPRHGSVHLHDSTVKIWEEPKTVDDAYTASFKLEVFEPLLRMLRRRGWRIGADARIQKHYRILSKWHRHGFHGSLEAKIALAGRTIEVTFFQNVANVENRHGGEHDFDKLEKMPYLLRQKAIATMAAVLGFLKSRHGYTFDAPNEAYAELKRGRITALEYLADNWARCGHAKKDLGRTVCDYDYNRKSRDGGLLEHAMKVWATDDKGRWMPGIAYYNLNSMWWVVFDRFTVRNLSCGQIRITKPADLRVKDNGRARRKHLEAELSKAVRGMDFVRAQTLKQILFADAQLFRVWAKDKNAWYRSNEQGYTDDVTSAGLYRADEVEGLRKYDDLTIVPVAA